MASAPGRRAGAASPRETPNAAIVDAAPGKAPTTQHRPGGKEPRFFVLDTPSNSVEVRGFSSTEVEDALRLQMEAEQLRAEHLDESRQTLVRTLMSRAQVPITPPASVRQAERLAAHRDALLATPIYTYATLATVRSGSASEPKVRAARAWVGRQRREHRVFTVDVNGAVLIPAFQLTETGRTRADLANVLRPLLEAGLDGWTVWSWLTRPSSLLSGGIPESVARTSPDRAGTAAARFAAHGAA